MSKLRLDYFLSIGGKIIAGDVITNTIGRTKEVALISVERLNIKDAGDSRRFIESFAWHTNTGKQECPDNMIVIIKGNNGFEVSDLAYRIVDWPKTTEKSSNVAYYAIVKWKPDIDALIEMQNTHDSNLSDLCLDESEYITNSAAMTNCTVQSPEEKEALDKLDNSITPTAEELDLLMQDEIEEFKNGDLVYWDDDLNKFFFVGYMANKEYSVIIFDDESKEVVTTELSKIKPIDPREEMASRIYEAQCGATGISPPFDLNIFNVEKNIYLKMVDMGVTIND